MIPCSVPLLNHCKTEKVRSSSALLGQELLKGVSVHWVGLDVRCASQCCLTCEGAAEAPSAMVSVWLQGLEGRPPQADATPGAWCSAWIQADLKPNRRNETTVGNL